jgi:uncharacterized protein YdcH (DUF465 family)
MDMTTIDPVRDELIKENPNFRDLVQQHQNYERRLLELAQLTYPNEEEQLEETSLKKKKLNVKDEIYAIIRVRIKTRFQIGGAKKLEIYLSSFCSSCFRLIWQPSLSKE